jgi:hypothetical protein
MPSQPQADPSMLADSHEQWRTETSFFSCPVSHALPKWQIWEASLND